MKKPLVVGNWKMYLESPEAATALCSALRRRAASFSGVALALAAPSPLLPATVTALKGSMIRAAAQGLSLYEAGAHTGEVSAAMLKNVGASLVLIGHSERRAGGEIDEAVREQVTRARAAGLDIVLCVGEGQRDPNGEHFQFVAAQLASALDGLDASGAGALAIAYEPVWAIGKSAEEAARPADIEGMIILIRKILTERFGRPKAARIPILYGGSVDGSNAQALLAESGVSGFLVGRASTNLESLMEILKLCKK